MSKLLNEFFLEPNRQWAKRVCVLHSGFFATLNEQQKSHCIWIVFSDNLVPANEITGLESSEVLVHRNVANEMVYSDLNALSTVQFSVERLGG